MKKRVAAMMMALILMMALMMGCQQGGAAPQDEAEGAAETLQESQAAQETEQEETQEASDDGGMETGLSIKNAQNFAIEYMADGVKLVTDSDGRKLLLVPEGVAAPAGYEDAVQVTTPIANVMYTSTTHIGFLGAMENESLYDSISALTTEEAEWTVQEVLDRFASGQITYIAQDNWTAGDIEGITALNPQLVFSVGQDESGVALRGQLDDVGIDYAVVTEWTEENSKASLEWIKFFAAFYNLDEEADAIYEAKLARMEELYEMTASIAEEDRPVVAYGVAYDGIVYTQGGGSTLAQELEKAGGIYAFKDLEGEGSVQLGMEEFLDKAKDADILIYASLPQYMMGTLVDVDPLFAEFSAYQNDQVYIYDKGHYMNSANVVEKFEDVVYICQPQLLEGHTLTMYNHFPQ